MTCCARPARRAGGWRRSTSSTSSTPRRSPRRPSRSGCRWSCRSARTPSRFHGALDPVAAATRVLAERASVPVVLHLDHAVSEPLVDEALGLGFRSVMFDGSTLDYADNRRGDRGPSPSGATPPASASRPSSARSAARTASTRPACAPTPTRPPRSSRTTGVDALAVAVGSSHAMTERTAALDLGPHRPDPRGGRRAAGAARLVGGARRRHRRGASGPG